MTTNVEKILTSRSENIIEDSDEDDVSLFETIISTNKSVDVRLQALEQYYEEMDEITDVTGFLGSMYNISGGSKNNEAFLYKICSHGRISAFIKLQIAKILLDYQETVFDEESYDDLTEISKRNKHRKEVGYKAMDFVCYDLNNIPTPCRVEAIFMLMGSELHYSNADSYFREFVRDTKIPCDFRYKTILFLENIGATEMRNELSCKLSDKMFMQKLYIDFNVEIDRILKELALPDWKALEQLNNQHLEHKCYTNIISKLSYESLKCVYRDEFPGAPIGRDSFIKNAQLAFLFHTQNDVSYRILSAQYLLQKCELAKVKHQQIEKHLLDFARDESLEYNVRADAADVLLRLGSDSMKEQAQSIIIHLGKLNGIVRTVFDDAQNVHTQEVESSVQDALEFLSTIPCVSDSGDPIDFSVVNEAIHKILQEDRDCLKVDGIGNAYCDHCNSVIIEKHTDVDVKDKVFCSLECLRFFQRDEKIKVSLNRIYLDRALYSKYNSTLSNILIKVWCYIQTNPDNKEELIKRLLEELEEMSGTCSAGFASRLVNVISGFGEFNIRISWENQIIANFIGRMNAKARKLLDSDSVFHTNKDLVTEVIYLWLLKPENTEIYEKIIKNTKNQITDITASYLNDNEYTCCIEAFAENVLNEITIPSSDYAARQSFSLFFRTYASQIREELYSEFKELMTDSEFDMYIRKAYMQYDI